MTKSKEPSERIYKILEWILEAIGWVRIVLSPLLLCSAIGAIIYLHNPNQTRFLIAIVIAIAGLIAGILFANKQWKTTGTMWFLSRVDASPDVDELVHEKDKKMT